MKTAMVIGVEELKSLTERLEMIKEAGFDAVDIGFYHEEKYLLDDGWQDRVAAVKAELDRIGLLCLHTHMPCYELCVDCEIIDENEEKAIRNAIVASKMLGANVGVIHPRSAAGHLYDQDFAMKHNIEQFGRLRDELVKNDFRLAIENIPVFPDGPHAIYFSSDYHDLINLVDALGDKEHFGICWDFGHAHLMSFSQVKALGEVGDSLIAVHVHNNSKTGDFHQPPSCGSLKFPAVMKALGETGYNELMSLELPFPPRPLWETWLAHMYDCCCWLIECMK